jgi:hypothetical protein
MTYTHGFAGLFGRQWMFIAEGIPTILLGLLTLYYLTDRPTEAARLTPAQRAWLQSELRAALRACPRKQVLRAGRFDPAVHVWDARLKRRHPDGS